MHDYVIAIEARPAVKQYLVYTYLSPVIAVDIVVFCVALLD